MRVSSLRLGDIVSAARNIYEDDGPPVIQAESIGVVIAPIGVAAEPREGAQVKWVSNSDGEIINKTSFVTDGDVEEPKL